MRVLGHAFTMTPTNDLAGSVSAHLEAGLGILWRPDRHTVLLGVDRRACVMIEDDPAECALGPGPVLLVDELSTLDPHEQERRWAVPPMDVPVGRYAAVSRAGTAFRYLDLSRCEERMRPWFGAGPSP